MGLNSTSALQLLNSCCSDIAGLIFVIDSADQQRIKEAQYELENVITNDEMRGIPVEILANKQDLPSTFQIMFITYTLS